MAKILLVEDDKSLREIYGVRLLAEGYDIVSAGDGEEALAMAIKERPQLILSDVMMPKISGFDMLDILRSTTETKDIKVIMMTALSSEDQRQRGESLGANRYLVKSQVGIEDVVRAVHEVLGDTPGAAQPAAQTNANRTAGATSFNSGAAHPARQNPTPQSQAAPQSVPAPQAAQPQQQPQPPASNAQQPAPASPQPQSPQPADDMPRPTAPFSTPRPANLGNRVIQPISGDDLSATDEEIAKKMQAELGSLNTDEAAPSTDTPVQTPAQEQPQPQAAQPDADQPNLQMAPPSAPEPAPEPTQSPFEAPTEATNEPEPAAPAPQQEAPQPAAPQQQPAGPSVNAANTAPANPAPTEAQQPAQQ